MATRPPTAVLSLIGVLAIILSAIGFSTKTILAKLAYRHGVDAITVLTLRMLFAAPIFLIVLALHKPSLKILRKVTRDEWIKIGAVGVIGWYGSAMLDFAGLQYVSASLERIILFSYPSIVLLLSLLIYKTKISRRALVALLVCYTGIILSFWSEHAISGKDSVVGTILVFGAACTYALYLVASSTIISRIGALAFSSLTLLFATVVLLAHFTAVHPLTLLIQSREIYGIIILMALFATVLPAFTLSYGISKCGASTAAIVSTVGPIATLGMANAILGEEISALQLVGGSLVIIGVLVLTVKKRVNEERVIIE